MSSYPIEERYPHSCKSDLDPIAGLIERTMREGEQHRSEEVEMDVAGNTVLRVFEVVIFEVCEAVVHMVLSGEEFLGVVEFPTFA